MLSLAEDNPQVAGKLLEWISQEVTRKTDLERLDAVVSQLQVLAQGEVVNAYG